MARFIALQDAHFTGNLITVGIAALVGYDYLLTVRREARLFWNRRVNAATILFFANRYLSLVYYVVLAYYRCLSLPYLDCQVQYYADCGLRHLQYVPWAVFSALRVYALSQRNWLVTAVTFFWSVLAFPLEYYGDFHLVSFVDDLVLGCMPTATKLTFLNLLGISFIRGGQVIADAIVIGVTWKATRHVYREGIMCFLTRVMFRNSNLYFITLLVLNLLHILFTFLPNSFLHIPFTNTSYVTRFAEPVTSILISHFILDLHETHRRTVHQGGSTGIQIMHSDIGRGRSRDSVSMEVEEWSLSFDALCDAEPVG